MIVHAITFHIKMCISIHTYGPGTLLPTAFCFEEAVLHDLLITAHQVLYLHLHNLPLQNAAYLVAGRNPFLHIIKNCVIDD